MSDVCEFWEINEILWQYDSHVHPKDNHDITFALPLVVSYNLQAQVALKQDIDFVCGVI